MDKQLFAFDDVDENEESSFSLSSPFSLMGGPSSDGRAADDDATTEWILPSIDPYAKATDAAAPAVMVHMVEEDKPEINCHHCEVCQAVIGPGMCQVSFQQDWDDRVKTLHSACLAAFAVGAGLVQEVFNAVVQHQPFVPEKLQGMMGLLSQELLDKKMMVSERTNMTLKAVTSCQDPVLEGFH